MNVALLFLLVRLARGRAIRTVRMLPRRMCTMFFRTTPSSGGGKSPSVEQADLAEGSGRVRAVVVR